MIAFLGYCLLATLRIKLRATAAGLTPRAVPGTLAGNQMVGVAIPTTDGRELVVRR